MKFFEMQSYGFNQIIKEYADFSQFLPLPAHLEHGWTALKEPLKTDLICAENKGLMLVFNQRRLLSWQEKSKVPVYIMGAPFIHYRRINHITKKATAKGTVAFPCHSTANVHSKYDIEKYCQALNKLSDEYKPISVCLHFSDYKDNNIKIYQKYGFKVKTAGKKIGGSMDFAKNFYQILSDHKYATSNEIGSYTFYAVEMEIPFFILGDRPYFINQNKTDTNVPEKYSTEDFEYGRKSFKLFSTGPVKYISDEQKKFIIRELGIKDCLSNEELYIILNKNFKENNYYLSIIPYWLYKTIKFIQKLFIN